jgi:hypothetical protein
MPRVVSVPSATYSPPRRRRWWKWGKLHHHRLMVVNLTQYDDSRKPPFGGNSSECPTLGPRSSAVPNDRMSITVRIHSPYPRIKPKLTHLCHMEAKTKETQRQMNHPLEQCFYYFLCGCTCCSFQTTFLLHLCRSRGAPHKVSALPAH